MTLQEMQAAYGVAQTELDGILALGDAVSAEQLTRGEALSTEMGTLQTGIEAFQVQRTALASASTAANAWASNVTRPSFGMGEAQGRGTAVPALAPGYGLPPGVTVPAIPASALRHRVKNFKADPSTGRSGQEQAYRFGMWLLAGPLKNQFAANWCKQHGIPLLRAQENADGSLNFAQTEGINTAGGFLVPTEFDSTIIDLREQYGIFRQFAKNVPMASDTKYMPRRTGGLTAYGVGENVAITESSKAWDRVTLVAKKIACLARMSSEVNEDSVVNLGDDLAQEIAYAFALFEDDCGFNGDGTSTYLGITGVCPALKGLSATIANIAGLVVATGTGYATSYGSVTLADLNGVKAKLPQYAHTPQTGWYCSQNFFSGTMERLALAAGGITEAMIVAGMSQQRFMGYPVHIAQKMPFNPAVSQVVCLFGDLSLAAMFGDRRSTTIAMSEHESFASDELTIRGTERIDINVHDVGNASATASARVPGPVVALITAAS